MTVNLLLTDAEPAAAAVPVAAAEAACLTEHFSTPVTSRYSDQDLGVPRRPAFLLDHEYTETSLTAGRFKGADIERVATLRAAAEQAGCECVFALTDIKEAWDAQPNGHSEYHDSARPSI